MFTLKVLSITKQTHAETSERYLDVTFSINKTDENDENPPKIMVERSLAFPFDTPESEIKNELQKYLNNFKAEEVQRKKQAVVDSEDENADDVINKLEGLSL